MVYHGTNLFLLVLYSQWFKREKKNWPRAKQVGERVTWAPKTRKWLVSCPATSPLLSPAPQIWPGSHPSPGHTYLISPHLLILRVTPSSPPKRPNPNPNPLDSSHFPKCPCPSATGQAFLMSFTWAAPQRMRDPPRRWPDLISPHFYSIFSPVKRTPGLNPQSR